MQNSLYMYILFVCMYVHVTHYERVARTTVRQRSRHAVWGAAAWAGRRRWTGLCSLSVWGGAPPSVPGNNDTFVNEL